MGDIDVQRLVEKTDNYLGLLLVEPLDLRVNGTTPQVLTMKEFTGHSTSPVVSVSQISMFLMFSLATVDFEAFGSSPALANGINISYRLNGVTIDVCTIKSLADLYKYFDLVTIETDGDTPTNKIFKADMEIKVTHDQYLQLRDKSTAGEEDAVIVTVSDDLSAVGVELLALIKGFGFV